MHELNASPRAPLAMAMPIGHFFMRLSHSGFWISNHCCKQLFVLVLCSVQPYITNVMVACHRHFHTRLSSLHRRICRKPVALFVTTGLVIAATTRRGILMSAKNYQTTTMILQDREAPLPVQKAGVIRCVILSDTHGLHWNVDPLPAGDVLIHLGDVAHQGSIQHIRSFVGYVKQYRDAFQDIVLLEGNHDRDLNHPGRIELAKEYHEIGMLVADQVVRVADGRLTILGVSWDACERNDFSKAEILASQWGQIDMLLTHAPPTSRGKQLSDTIGAHVHLFGHVHRQRGIVSKANKDHGCLRINCSSIPAYRPVVIDWDPDDKRAVMVKF